MGQTIIYQMHYTGFDEKKSTPVIIQMDAMLNYCYFLGVDYVWLSPVFKSPRRDHGYDVSSYTEVDPRLGSTANLKEFIESAHKLGIKVMSDLVINHTSTEHPWFKERPEFYYWRDSKPENDSGNIFDGGSCWEPCGEKYYFHCFDKGQADLAWFPNGPDGGINQPLVEEFRKIIKTLTEMGFDGFRLDAMQCINKIPAEFDLGNTLSPAYMQMAADVIDAIFESKQGEKPLLLGELLDITGEAVPFYEEHSKIDLLMDTAPHNLTAISTSSQLASKHSLQNYIDETNKCLDACKRATVAIESHDSVRFPSAFGISGREALDVLFGFKKAKAIILYQGQELGLRNPADLMIEQACELDAGARLRRATGESDESILASTRANNRVVLPFVEYTRQVGDPYSLFNYTEKLIGNAKGNS